MLNDWLDRPVTLQSAFEASAALLRAGLQADLVKRAWDSFPPEIAQAEAKRLDLPLSQVIEEHTAIFRNAVGYYLQMAQALTAILADQGVTEEQELRRTLKGKALEIWADPAQTLTYRELLLNQPSYLMQTAS